MKLYNFIIVRITFFYIAGICLGFYSDLNILLLQVLSLSLIFLLGIEWYYSGKRFIQQSLFGLLSYSLIFTIGINRSSLAKDINRKNHYSHFLEKDREAGLELKIRKVWKPTAFYDRYEADVLQMNYKKLRGKILMNIPRKDSLAELIPGQHFYTSAALYSIRPPLNPHQFNYSKFLEKKNIYHQIYPKPDYLLEIEKTSAGIYGWTARLRKKIKASLKGHGMQGEELAIVNALLLGQRRDISDELYNNYTRAGAIHILAVSGLHIGIILLLLHSLLKPLEYLGKRGRLIKMILILGILWAFAILSGLSSSVLRAVGMFSFISFGLYRKRQINNYLLLTGSLFFLLCVNPLFLFDIGFQLSYTAVFSILWIQPLIFRLWVPQHGLTRYFWRLFSASMAAQLGVLPLSLFYFHQFPALFFVSNLIIIPFLGFILGLGITIICLALTDVLPSLIMDFYTRLIALMNRIIAWVADKETFLFEDIYFDTLYLVLFYFLIPATVYFQEKRRYRSAIGALVITALLFSGREFYLRNYHGQKEKFIVFHQNRKALLAKQKASNLVLFGKANKTSYEERLIRNYSREERLSVTQDRNSQRLFKLNNISILVVDSLGIYQFTEHKADYVILCDSPKIHLERLIKLHQPKKIIADGSNYKSYVERWMASCRKEKIPFHYTGEKGVFIIE
ncbi:DUF4131 domain-containing protein [Leptobacterium flavescens]|uniref:DUF4131 domain-containing protein n=1 Tax=Leptobacterium flavescens TaxID=472055 RepID=A0A6P0US30_9FLAO|nr:ComEC/Rec2 family competence protein [Leptobacterium flavescens]NER14788.1 DUF4131 domain-containing protein [Leptobacterium flavescens]